jgi:hypothetical protein
MGGSGTGADVELGRENLPYELDATIIGGFTPNNVALAGYYWNADRHGNPIHDPGVGVYGSGNHDRGIGVAGSCDERGVGVYGMALDRGIGIVGRSMSGDQGEDVPPIDFVENTAGILGQAKAGVGVFGHGGPLTEPQINPPSLDPDPRVRGGVFSAGWRTFQNVRPAQDPQLVSLSSRPQIQLVPSTNSVLPAQAQLGDIYFVLAFGAPWPSIGQLWICTQIQGTTPVWQQIQLGSAVVGGSQIPRAPSRRRSDRGRGPTARKSVIKKKAKKKSKGT